jgi:sodium-dependent dicarboxylate transporter 2/3/5
MESDSRYAATQYYLRQAWPFGRKATLFLVSVLAGFLAVMLVPAGALSKPALYTLFMLVVAVSLWITEAVPPFAVGILIMAFLVFAMGSLRAEGEPVDVMQYVNTWSSPVIWLMLSGFFISEGLQRTGLGRMLFSAALKCFGCRAPRLLMGIMLITATLSAIMSNTATTAMMIAAILPFLQKCQKDNALAKDLLLGIPAAAAVGGMITIIGSPPNAITVGTLATNGVSLSFVGWMLYGLPQRACKTHAHPTAHCRSDFGGYIAAMDDIDAAQNSRCRSWCNSDCCAHHERHYSGKRFACPALG